MVKPRQPIGVRVSSAPDGSAAIETKIPLMARLWGKLSGGTARRTGRDYPVLVAVFAGGVVGTLMREVLSDVMPAPESTAWPWSTFIANMLGAVMIGYFTTRLLEQLPVSRYRRPFLGTGVCGGLTTFSTLQVEVLGMLEHHRWLLAASYTAGSIGFGLLAVYLSTAAVRRATVVR